MITDLTQMEVFLMRRQKKIKLSQIAEYIGCSVALLSKYENNKVAMDLVKVKKYNQFILDY